MYGMFLGLGSGARKVKKMYLGNLGPFANVLGLFLEKIFVRVMWDEGE